MEELVTSRNANSRELIDLGPQNVFKWLLALSSDNLVHLGATALIQASHFIQQCLGRFLVTNIVAYRGYEDRTQILRSIR